jgi:putative transposase
MKRRKLNRLDGYNYSQQGMYFITICTKNREYIFGEIVNEKMILNDIGKITERYWLEIPNHFPHVSLDEFIVMPNHVHGIIEIKNNLDVGNAHVRSKNINRSKMLISKAIHGFKSSVTRRIFKNQERMYAFPTKFAWQKSFYDRIIRNEIELNKIREYIFKNPINWEQDRNNSANIFM